MRREASIPLFLWAASAVLAHLVWGGGADQAARVIEERLDVGRFAAGIRSHVKSSIAPPVEIALDDGTAEEEEKPEEKEPTEPTVDEAKEDVEEAPDAPVAQEKKPPKKPEKKPEEEQKPDPEAKEEEKPTPTKPELTKPAPPAEPAKPVPQFVMPNKIAVQQHVEDEKQKDNPDANYISDKANRVEQETRAQITSTDQNDKQPTPGSSPRGPKEDPGNAEETHVRQDMDVPGLKDFAPGGSQKEEAERATAATPAPKQGQAAAAAPGAPGSQVEKAPSRATAESQERNQVAKSATHEHAGSPETVASNDGSFTVPKAQAATPEQRAQKAMKRLPPRRPRSLLESLGLGAAGRTDNGVALNLTPTMATEAVGSDEMSRLRRADGERRRSAHRGSWATPSFERYRSAIENYVPSVKPGNQTALNTAAVPFAAYLHQIHNRIHPLFADSFLGSLERLPASHPMNDRTLITALEIVVDREEGRLVRRGVTRASGITAFDVSAIAAVDRAAPFGTPPNEIVSPDGNVYLHWEFRRDDMACSTMFAHPFILNVQPKPAPAPTTPPLPPFRGPDDAAPQTGERHGRAEPPAPAPAPAPPG
jgi:TonB C terminal